MSDNENIHAGHRERAIEKLLKNSEAIENHELLEIMLFCVVPRKDTNALSHRLLRTFGTLSKVFSASAKELMSVEGVGKQVAAQIMIVGGLLKRLKAAETDKKKCYSRFDAYRQEVLEYFSGLFDEKFLIILLDGKYKEIIRLNYEDRNRSSVSGDIPEIAKAFALHKPEYAIIAHNHPSGFVTPSREDDINTAKINLLCSVHGVSLIDHVIVAGNKAFSYFVEGRMEEIKSNYDLDFILKQGKEIGI